MVGFYTLTSNNLIRKISFISLTDRLGFKKNINLQMRHGTKKNDVRPRNDEEATCEERGSLFGQLLNRLAERAWFYWCIREFIHPL